MSIDIGMIYADIASTFAVALMLIIIKTQYKQDRRIQKIEDDLYLDSCNPVSMPLTKQIFNLQQDMSLIKENFEKLNSTIENLNTIIQDYLKPVNKKTKKRGGKND
jgi:vacuolar-type H+-ATPase subunit I/STV1